MPEVTHRGGTTIETTEKSLKLKVSEALSKDVSRGYARMGPEDLALLQLGVGDILEVVGKGRSVCKAMPAYKDLRGQSRIQLDGITRENAGTGLDEFVQVRKIACPPAERVVFVPSWSLVATTRSNLSPGRLASPRAK